MVRFLGWPFIYFSEATVDDRISGGRCLEEHEIESLVRHKLSAEAERRCQAHLLWCASCQNKVQEEAEFACAARSAAALLEQQKAEATRSKGAEAGKNPGLISSVRKWFSPRFSGRWVAVAAAAGVLVAVMAVSPLRRGTTGEEVDLRSERGSATTAVMDASASATAQLRIDVSDVAPYPAYQVAIVDAGGRTVAAKAESATAGKLIGAFNKRLTPGRYWIRLSSPDGHLLREYALRVQP